MSLAVRQTTASTGETIYWPSGTPRGGIVCPHGSQGGLGGWNELVCALFAAHGFAALSRNYTRSAQWLTHPDIDDVPLEGTQRALAAMQAEIAPFGCRLGLQGGSRGAEHALLLAHLLVEDGRAEVPDAVAVHSPPDAAWPAFIVADFQTGKPWAGNRARPASSWSGTHDRTRPGTQLCPGPICYPVFLTQATVDRIWGASMARVLVERMTKNRCPPEAHFFEGEDHIFRVGARNRAWELKVDFFDRHLAKRE